jgi:hypothetical protein
MTRHAFQGTIAYLIHSGHSVFHSVAGNQWQVWRVISFSAVRHFLREDEASTGNGRREDLFGIAHLVPHIVRECGSDMQGMQQD